MLDAAVDRVPPIIKQWNEIIEDEKKWLVSTGLAKEDQKYKSSIQAFGLILKEEGVAAYFRGASANIFRGLGGTLVLVGFDYFKDF